MALTSQQLKEVDELFIDIARKIQISATKHEQAETSYRALCDYVDRDGSPLMKA